MNKYYFVARAPTGKKYKGKIQAEDENELNAIILDHEYSLIKWHKITEKEPFITINKIGINDIVNLSEKLVMLLRTGINLSDSIFMASDTFSNKKFKNILKDIVKEMNKGKNFSQTLAYYPKIFPEFYRTMIEVAEVSGKMVETLEYLIKYYNFEIKIKHKIRTAMFYPCMLLVLSIVVLIIVCTFVIPNFNMIFSQMNVTLPLLTKIIINVSSFITKNYLYILLGLLLFILLLIIYFKTGKGKKIKDYLKLKIPLIKTISINNLSSKFCKSLTMLNDAGLPTLVSLQTVSELIGNKYVHERFNFAVGEVKRGESISNALATMNVFPDLLIQTLQISEKTGSLSYSLKILGNIYEEEVENKLQKYSTMIEPLFIIFISLLVVLLIVAIFVPLFSMLDNIGNF